MPQDAPYGGTTFPPSARPWTVRRASAPPPAVVERAEVPRDTRYTISWLDRDGLIEDRTVAAPSTPLFTDAFAAIARGGLVLTPDGATAIEDLLPGDRVITSRGAEPLLWKGNRVIAPSHRNLTLYRVAADSLGPGRPMPDLLLGPAARLVSRRTALRTLIGADAALVPVAALADGEAVIEIHPMSMVDIFHLGFARHATFTVNGVELDSVHPGALTGTMPDTIERLYMSLFPHLSHPSDFGTLAMQRLYGDILAKITHAA